MPQATLVSAVAFPAVTDKYTFRASMMGRPLFTAPIVGLIPGDFQAGIMISATLELMFMGSIMVGSVTPPEVCASSMLGAAIAAQSGEGVGTTVTLALSLSILLQMWRNGCYAIGASWGGKQTEKALAQRDLRRANIWHLIILPLMVGAPSMFLVFSAMYFGASSIDAVTEPISQVVLDGLDVTAGVLSCVGLTLLIKVMDDKRLVPYLLLGLIAVMCINTDVIGVAVAGLCMTLIAAGNMKFEEEGDFWMRETKETSLITKKDLRSVFWRSLTMQPSWSLDKIMACGFMYSIEKPLRKIYPKDNDYFEALHRHTGTFNIMSRVSSFVIDFPVTMEQERAKTDNLNKESISNLKVGLMGPLPGIGDSFFWGTFRIITAGIGIALTQQGSILGALLYFLLYTAIHFLTKYIIGNASYKMGAGLLESSAENYLIEKVSYGASTLGLTVIGAMVGTTVTLKTSLTFQFSGTETTSQSTFDQIPPGLLPLGTTFLCVWLFNWSIETIAIIPGIFAICIAGYWTGIF